MASATPTPARDASRPRGAARREALLEAVLQIVAQTGPDAVTHRRVAEVAGLPLASTTYWFQSRDHLLTAALELAAERDIARLARYAADAALGAVDPLDAAIAAIIDPPGEGPLTGRGSLIASFALLLEAARRPALQEISRRWTEAYHSSIARLLRAAGSRRPREDAAMLVAAADGLLIEQLATGTDEELRPRLRRLAGALVAS